MTAAPASISRSLWQAGGIMPDYSSVFIVHGRDSAARDTVISFVAALGLRPVTWTKAVELTGLGSPSTLQIVEAGINAAQAVVVILTGDDVTKLRPELGTEKPNYQPRANVLFEAGWAIGLIGQQRTVLVRFGEVAMPSDIRGINDIRMDNSAAKRSDLRQRLISAGCVIDTVSTEYLRPETAGDFVGPGDGDTPGPHILDRGGFTDFLVDSTLSYHIDNLKLQDELCQDLSGNASRTLKYNYIGSSCAQNWLTLSQDPAYGHSDLVDSFKKYSDEIVDAAAMNAKSVDFVSLGPGDGTIDVKIIDSLQRKSILAHYYPLDLSVELLQTSVSLILRQDFLCRRRPLKIKAIHGDFTKLPFYKPIFAYDAAINFVALVGYSLGNHNESELLGKLLEGMESGDLLLFDIRLHQLGFLGNNHS
jgi:predicted nucleotide-binding protein